MGREQELATPEGVKMKVGKGRMVAAGDIWVVSIPQQEACSETLTSLRARMVRAEESWGPAAPHLPPQQNRTLERRFRSIVRNILRGIGVFDLQFLCAVSLNVFSPYCMTERCNFAESLLFAVGLSEGDGGYDEGEAR